jgi:hypothetical protein
MLVRNRQLDSVLRFYSAPWEGDKRSALQGLHNGLHELDRQNRRISKSEGAQCTGKGRFGAFDYGRVDKLGSRAD